MNTIHPQIVTFVELKNKDRMGNGEPLIRFADLYHSAHRTPTSTCDVPRLQLTAKQVLVYGMH